MKNLTKMLVIVLLATTFSALSTTVGTSEADARCRNGNPDRTVMSAWEFLNGRWVKPVVGVEQVDRNNRGTCDGDNVLFYEDFDARQDGWCIRTYGWNGGLVGNQVNCGGVNGPKRFDNVTWIIVCRTNADATQFNGCGTWTENTGD